MEYLDQKTGFLLTFSSALQVDPRRKDPDEKPPASPVRMPMIDTDKGQMDVISRLLKDRILLLGQGVDDEVANVLVAQLLYLANEDPEKDITLYINSPVCIPMNEFSMPMKLSLSYSILCLTFVGWVRLCWYGHL